MSYKVTKGRDGGRERGRKEEREEKHDTKHSSKWEKDKTKPIKWKNGISNKV